MFLLGGASLQIGLQKIDNENLLVNWSPPPPNDLNGITAYQVNVVFDIVYLKIFK